jgi:hypothetical protein
MSVEVTIRKNLIQFDPSIDEFGHQWIESGVQKPVLFGELTPDYPDTYGVFPGSVIGGVWRPTYPDRFLIPENATFQWVKPKGSIVWGGIESVPGTTRQIVIKKGNIHAADPDETHFLCCGGVENRLSVYGTTTDHPIEPIAKIRVVPGDYFILRAFHLNGATLPILLSTGTCFSLEIF